MMKRFLYVRPPASTKKATGRPLVFLYAFWLFGRFLDNCFSKRHNGYGICAFEASRTIPGHKRHLGFFHFFLLVHERRHMVRRSQHSFLKHQKEMKRKEEAATKWLAGTAKPLKNRCSCGTKHIRIFQLLRRGA